VVPASNPTPCASGLPKIATANSSLLKLFPSQKFPAGEGYRACTRALGLKMSLQPGYGTASQLRCISYSSTGTSHMGGFASDGETSTAAQEGIDSATPAKMDGMLM